MSKIHSTSLLSTPWPFWTGILSQVSKNDDEKKLLLRVIWLYTCIENTTDIRMGRTYDCKLIFGIKVNSRDNVLTLTRYVGFKSVFFFCKYT